MKKLLLYEVIKGAEKKTKKEEPEKDSKELTEEEFEKGMMQNIAMLYSQRK